VPRAGARQARPTGAAAARRKQLDERCALSCARAELRARVPAAVAPLIAPLVAPLAAPLAVAPPLAKM